MYTSDKLRKGEENRNHREITKKKAAELYTDQLRKVNKVMEKNSKRVCAI